MMRLLGSAVGLWMVLACVHRSDPSSSSEIERMALLDSIDRDQDAHFDDILRSAILVTPQVNCPMPVVSPDGPGAFRMPVARRDSIELSGMPIERSGCRNPLFVPRTDSVPVPPNKRLKLAARVEYCMTPFSSARRSLSAIR